METLPVALRILLIGNFLSLLGVPAYHILLGYGRVRQVLFSHLIKSAVNVVIVVTVVMAGLLQGLTMVCFVVLLSMGSSTLYLIVQKINA